MNVPLRDGIDDESYEALFKPLMAKVSPLSEPARAHDRDLVTWSIAGLTQLLS